MMLREKLPAVLDAEGQAVASIARPLIDAHVHVFPDGIFKSVRKWFDAHGWPVRYRQSASGVLEFLFSRGVSHVVALQYAHKPGIAPELNRFMAGLCDRFPGRVTGLATVFPGETGAIDILRAAFGLGLNGVKLHAHVQCFDMNSPEMDMIYELCRSEGKPILMHVGREPNSPSYKCDPYLFCRSDKLERVLIDYPGLKICVPHLGIDENAAYQRLIERYDHLWLDTAMAMTAYLPGNNPVSLDRLRADRILYGSDFPNIPFAWDHELKWICAAGYPESLLKLIFSENASEFYGIYRVPTPNDRAGVMKGFPDLDETERG